ncbi:MAG: undecaprenyldiphospho-muramoylpentapeptide beta-N-acetylglucosaminyltransferase [Prosthecobacter sp.]|nr:undecaprenyldiphospho-muramoylpentapeptide beta-N-acetylglucosaminyltransferase [Prosthecobacter sp.]
MKSRTEKSVHVLIACGGTGGHLFPGIAVGEVLASRGHDVTLLISEKKIDDIAASGHKELRFEKLPFLAMPKPWSPKMPGFLLGLWKGAKACRRIIRDHEVKVVLGMGGFTSFAPLYAGKKENCLTLIHESNAIPGKANRLNARFANIVLCGLEACKPHFVKHPDVRAVGTPVRSTMRNAAQEDPHAFFKLDKDKKTLLIMGGSQGARGVNRVVGSALEQFERMGIQVLHIAGPTDYEEVRDVYAKHPLLPQHVAAFCHRMDMAYRIADLAIARSGASSMSELAYFGVPSLLIPYPFAAEDHQTKNAQIFDQAGASKLLQEKDLNADILADTVRQILTDPHVSDRMKKAAQKLAVRDSAETIADLIEKQVA